MATDYATEVTQLFQAIEYRPPDPATLATDVGYLTSGLASLAEIQSAIENDAYTTILVDPIIREYQAAFGRVPDQAGAAYWTGTYAADPASLAEMNTVFANAAEFTATYNGANATTIGDANLVAALYQNVLDRAPDTAGLDYWVASI